MPATATSGKMRSADGQRRLPSGGPNADQDAKCAEFLEENV